MSNLKDLEQKILKHNELYTQGIPEISDDVYDTLVDELKKLAPTSEVLKKVGANVKTAQKGVTYAHVIEMGSLHKINNEEDLNKWLDTVPSEAEDFEIQLKLDGISLEVVYDRDGKLIRAVTRGDGKIGQVVTFAASKMGLKTERNANIPHKIDETGEVQSFRGEAIISKKDFDGACKARMALGKAAYANPRNAAAGIVSAKEPHGVEFIDFICFDAEAEINANEKLRNIKELGFTPVDSISVKRHKLQEAFGKIAAKRDILPYEIDGIVLKVRSYEVQQEMGIEDQRPKWARAYKFPNQTTTAQVESISWSIGSTGRCNPIIHIEPTELAGVTITNITGNNADFLLEKKVSKGATVIISRRNDVIPAIEETVLEGVDKLEIPQVCPSCGSDLVTEDKLIYCEKKISCPGALHGQMMNFIREIDWKGMGETSVQKLIDSGALTQPADLFKFTEADLEPAMGTANSKKMIREIKNKSTLTLDSAIGVIGVTGLKRTRCRTLMEAGYDTFEKLKKLTYSDLIKIEGFGDVLSRQIVEGLQEREEWITNLLEVITLKSEVKSKELSGLAFQFTGKMTMKRKDLEGLARENGAATSWKKNLRNVLVINDLSSSSSKAQKAKKLGYKMITEDQFMALLDD